MIALLADLWNGPPATRVALVLFALSLVLSTITLFAGSRRR